MFQRPPNGQSVAAGQQSLARPVRHHVVVAIILRNGAPAAVLFAVPLVAAVVEGEWQFAQMLLACLTICLSAFMLRGRWPIEDDVTRAEALASTALTYAIAAALMALPFTALGMSPTDAVFESMSGITTTGLSVAQDLHSWPQSGLVARAWLQWCGGAFFLLAALALIVGPGRIAARLGAAQLDKHGILGSTRTRARSILLIYACLTLACFALLLLANNNIMDAALLSLSAVSTGGFSHYADSLASIHPAAIAIITIFTVLCAISISSYALFAEFRMREFFMAREVIVLLAMIAATSALIISAESSAGSGLTWNTVGHGLAIASSAQTTAGFSTMAVGELAPVSQIALIASMTVGGDLGSTAGGLKIGRLLLAMHLVYVVLTRTLMPQHAVYQLKIGGSVVKIEEVSTVFCLVMLFVAAQLLSWLAFVSYGFPPLASLFEVTSALSTVGLSTGVTSADMPATLKFLLIFLMWLGRVEHFGVLILLLPRTWKGTA